MSYTFDNRTAWGIARCNINQSRTLSWFFVNYVTLVAAVTSLVSLAADAVAIRVFVVEFLALTAVYCFIFHNIHCSCFFHAHTSRNTHQTSRKGRNLGQNAHSRRILFYSFLTFFQRFYQSIGKPYGIICRAVG